MKYGIRSWCVATSAVAICLAATGCAVSNALNTDASVSLRSAEDAKVFEPPENVTYSLESVSLNSSRIAWKPRVDTSNLHTDGSLIFSDGMITKMSLDSELPSGKQFSFTLNEPVVLRPEGDPGSHLAAYGTVEFGSYTDSDFVLWVTPQFGDTDADNETDSIDMKAEVELPSQIPIHNGQSNSVELVLHYTQDSQDTQEDTGTQ